MHRLMVIMLAALIMCGSIVPASAEHIKGAGGAGLDFNAYGSWRMSLNHLDNIDDFNADGNSASESDFDAWIRARTWFEFVASENLKAVLGTEIGDVSFGNGAGALGTDAIAIKVKHAYLQFKMPNCPATIIGGLQGIYVPGNYGSLVLDDDAAALMFAVPFNEMASLTFGWVRAFNNDTANKADEYDVFAFIGDIKTPKVGVQPYFLYANIGQDFTNATGVSGLNKAENAWWVGASAQIKPIEQLVILADLIYGRYNSDLDTRDAKGWGTVLAVDYVLPMVTPEIFALYFTGNDDDATDGSERMPTISTGFTATSFLADGSAVGVSALTPFSLIDPAAVGLWAIGVKAKQLTFVPGLTHDIVLMYGRGTNDEDGATPGETFTTEDSLIEFNFDTQYKIYEQLTGYLELGYVRISADDDVHGEDAFDDPAIKAVLGFKYDF